MEKHKFIINLIFVAIYAIALLIDIVFGITSFKKQNYKISMIQFFGSGIMFKILLDSILDLFK